MVFNDKLTWSTVKPGVYKELQENETFYKFNSDIKKKMKEDLIYQLSILFKSNLFRSCANSC